MTPADKKISPRVDLYAVILREITFNFRAFSEIHDILIDWLKGANSDWVVH